MCMYVCMYIVISEHRLEPFFKVVNLCESLLHQGKYHPIRNIVLNGIDT